MKRVFLTVVLSLLAITLDIGLLPFLGVGGSVASLVTVVVVALALLGFPEDALLAAVLGGLLLDLFAEPPFGIRTGFLLLVLALLILSARRRLVARQLLLAGIALAIVGVLAALVETFPHPVWLTLLGGLLAYPILGLVVFPLLSRLYPRSEVVKV